MPIQEEFPHRWHVTVPALSETGPVQLPAGDLHLTNTMRVALLRLWFTNAGFNVVPLPLDRYGFIVRHTSPHAMLMFQLTGDTGLPFEYTVMEL